MDINENKLQGKEIKKKSFTDVTIRSVASRSKFYRVSRMEKLRTERDGLAAASPATSTVTTMPRWRNEGERVVSQSTHIHEDTKSDFCSSRMNKDFHLRKSNPNSKRRGR